ncbi:MAG: end-binding protein Ku [Thermoleophilaceae bacterium]|nr:end-binding protein Ku [Thermoleophilaceae bacterium]MEA2389155.1 end-binding protein Ku [Thermoleophilaceae bacterium]
MPRSIWTGAISFGLVNVPVKLYSAVSKKNVRFHQLHESDGVRIQQKRVCPADGEEVPWDDIVKGYEISPDQYVVVTPEELEALDPKKTKTIDIEEFVDLEEIDPLFYDHPYYLLPGQGAAKPYKLLADAMKDANKVAIARVVIRTKEQLVAIRPHGDILAMATMNFADEVVDPDSFDEAPGDDIDTTKRELDMARQLIASLTSQFEPSKYHDEYREAVLGLIEKKAEGQEVVLQPAEEPEQVPDLMAALEASLAAAKKEGGGDNGSSGKKKPAAKRGSGSRAKPKAKAKSKS